MQQDATMQVGGEPPDMIISVKDAENYDLFTSRENLLRIKRNDPSLVMANVDINDSRLLPKGDIEAFGRSIGNNTRLQKLTLQPSSAPKEAWKSEFRLLWEGIGHNRSIENLIMKSGLFGADVFQSLAPFLEQNDYLKMLRIWDWHGLNSDGMSSLMGPLMRRRSPLAKLDLSGSISEDSVEVLVTALQNNPAMTPKEIHLDQNRIRQDGFRSIATLLQDPRCTMEILNLHNCKLDSNSAIMFANALARNTRLKELDIYNRFDDYMPILRAFSQTLSNTTSINTTYSSNHSLQVLKYHYETDYLNPLHFDIRQYLRWNKNENKKMVARKKVFMKHFVNNFVMPFEGMEPELLVRVLAFMDKATEENGGLTNAVARNLILTELVTMNPMVCDIAKPGPSQDGSDRKRKYG